MPDQVRHDGFGTFYEIINIRVRIFHAMLKKTIKIRKESNKNKNVSDFFISIYSKLAKCLYYLLAFPKKTYRRFFSIQKQISFSEARSQVLSAIEFLEKGSTNSNFPWLLDRDKNSLSQAFKVEGSYIKNSAFSSGSGSVLFDEDSTRFYRWDILTLYSEYPIPSLFDFGRFIKSFPKQIRSNYDSFCKDGQLSERFKGKEDPELLEIIGALTAMHTEWVGELFIHPLNPAINDDSNKVYNSLYGFSGHLIGGLLVLSEMISSIKSGLSFQHIYAAKLKKFINDFFENIHRSNVTIADLIFLHCAVWKFWMIINGITDDIKMKSNENGIIFSPKISRYQKNAPVIDQVRIFFVKNPISPLLLLDFLSDTRVLNPDEKRYFTKIGCLFKRDINDDVIFWLANHVYSGLMASYMKNGYTCFRTEIPDSSEKLFNYRVYCLAQILNSAFEEIGDNIKVKNRFLLLCFYFYEILLREWLQEFNIEDFSSHPLPMPDGSHIPFQVSLSHILISKSKDKSDKKKLIDELIIEELKNGGEFAPLAREYSEDSLNGRAGGSLGSIKIGDLPPDQEPAVFLAQEDNSLFILTTKEAYHIFHIHEREFSEKTSLFERVIQCCQRDENHEMKPGYLSLLKPLDILIKSFDQSSFSNIDKDSIERFKKLYQKAQPFQRMLAFSQESITPK